MVSYSRSMHVGPFRGTDSLLIRQRFASMTVGEQPLRKYENSKGRKVSVWRAQVWVQPVPTRWLLFRMRSKINRQQWLPAATIRTKNGRGLYMTDRVYYVLSSHGHVLSPTRSLFDNPMLWADYQVSAYLRKQ